MALPILHVSAFELVNAVVITTANGSWADGRGRVVWVSAADADRLVDPAWRVARREARIADLAGGLVS